MSKLIDEYPLLVLPSLACDLGLNQAIFVQQLHYWIKKAGKNRDGRDWVYNTLEDWDRQFPFWSKRTLQRVISGLVESGVVIKGSYNKLKSDRTVWYTLNYECQQLAMNHMDNLTTPCGQLDHMHMDNLTTPLPENNTETTTEKTPIPPKGAKTRNSKTTGSEPFEAWWKLYNRKGSNKAKAWEIWRRDGLDDRSDDLMTATRAYRTDQSDDAYMKHAERFLRHFIYDQYLESLNEENRRVDRLVAKYEHIHDASSAFRMLSEVSASWDEWHEAKVELDADSDEKTLKWHFMCVAKEHMEKIGKSLGWAENLNQMELREYNQGALDPETEK